MGKEKQELIINVNNRAGAREIDIKHAKKSVEIVWNNLIGKDMFVNIDFVDYIVDEDGKLKDEPDTDSDEYINGSQEAEAWDIALNAFKRNWYEAKGTFIYKGKEMVIPEKSKFD